MTEKSNPDLPPLGYTDTATVKLDFDDASFKFVKDWALKATKWFKLGGFIILKSSKNCYHVIFDRTVTWKKNMHVVAWVWVESKNEGLGKWFGMQCIKESSTLRVTSKKEKTSPRIVFRHSKQEHEIQSYLEWRQFIKKIDKKRKRARNFVCVFYLCVFRERVSRRVGESRRWEESYWVWGLKFNLTLPTFDQSIENY